VFNKRKGGQQEDITEQKK